MPRPVAPQASQLVPHPHLADRLATEQSSLHPFRGTLVGGAVGLGVGLMAFVVASEGHDDLMRASWFVQPLAAGLLIGACVDLVRAL